jgi:hypothetical protein
LKIAGLAVTIWLGWMSWLELGRPLISCGRGGQRHWAECTLRPLRRTKPAWVCLERPRTRKEPGCLGLHVVLLACLFLHPALLYDLLLLILLPKISCYPQGHD